MVVLVLHPCSFFKDYFEYLGSLQGYVNFIIQYTITAKEKRDYVEITYYIKYVNVKRSVILILRSLTIHEHDIVLHFFRSSLISLSSAFLFSCESLITFMLHLFQDSSCLSIRF